MQDPYESFDAIALRNVRCFEDAVVPLHRQVTVLIGENGAGKSTVSQAFASLAFGESEGLAGFPLRWGTKEGRIALESGGETRAEWVHGGSRRRLGRRPWLLVYGRYRGIALPPGVGEGAVGAFDLPVDEIWNREEWGDEGGSRDLEADRATTIVRPDEELLRSRTRVLLQIADGARHQPRLREAWDALGDWLLGLDEELEGLRVGERGGRDVLLVLRRGQELSFDEIADGYKSVLSIVFDLLARFSIADARMNPLETPGLVVIDEIDLHLHPRWQRAVVGQLVSLFPNLQFVLTTHSPSVVQGAIDEDFGVVLLSDEGERVQPLEDEEREQLKHAELGAVVVADSTFGVRSRYSPEIEEKEQAVSALRAKVEEGTATELERKELVTLLDELQQRFAQDERLRGQELLMSELAKSQLAFIRDLERSRG